MNYRVLLVGHTPQVQSNVADLASYPMYSTFASLSTVRVPYKSPGQQRTTEYSSSSYQQRCRSACMSNVGQRPCTPLNSRRWALNPMTKSGLPHSRHRACCVDCTTEAVEAASCAWTFPLSLGFNTQPVVYRGRHRHAGSESATNARLWARDGLCVASLY